MKNAIFGVRLPLHLLYIFVGLLFVLPLWWSLTSSLRPLEEIFKYTSPFSLRALFLDHLDFSAYFTLFTERGFGVAVLHSVFVAAVTIRGDLIITRWAGFVFAGFQFPGRQFLFFVTVLSFLVPFEA